MKIPSVLLPSFICLRDIQLHSVVDVSDESDIHVVSDEHATAWEDLYVPSIRSREDPNRAPTEVAPSLRKNQPLELLLELKQRSE